MKLLTFSIFFLLFPSAIPSRILAIVSDPAYSHQSFFFPLWKALALRGHEIVLITTDSINEPIPNLQEILIPETHELEKQKPAFIMAHDEYQFRILTSFGSVGALAADYQLALPQLKQVIANETEHFDLLMVESWVPAMFAFKHRFNCALIMITSYDTLPYNHEAMGNPSHLLQYPNSFIAGRENMSFLDRLLVFSLGCIQKWYLYVQGEEHNRVIAKYFGERYPDYIELVGSADMLFINANPVFVPVRPHAPNTVSLVGGMHLKPPEPLSEDLGKFLNTSKHGVIYFNLGSSVQSTYLPHETQTIILETFAKLKYDVLWKFEASEVPGRAENVKYIKWAPQQDILRHQNVKLFITQGGMQSLEEALYYHIPLVAIPIYGDQYANAHAIKAKGIGQVVQRHGLTVNEFEAVILEVINNPNYKAKITEIGSLVYDIPMKPLENAIWWTEYVLRHKGAQHLKGRTLIWYQYYYLDIFGIVVMSLFLIFVIIQRFLMFFYGVTRNLENERVKKE